MQPDYQTGIFTFPFLLSVLYRFTSGEFVGRFVCERNEVIGTYQTHTQWMV